MLCGAARLILKASVMLKVSDSPYGKMTSNYMTSLRLQRNFLSLIMVSLINGFDFVEILMVGYLRFFFLFPH